MARYGPSAELNPVIRAVGVDQYFAVWTMSMTALCKENRQWQDISLAVWLVETWAVNTHYQTGTVQGIPLVMVQLDAGGGGFANYTSPIVIHLSSTRKIPLKQPAGKSLLGQIIGQAI